MFVLVNDSDMNYMKIRVAILNNFYACVFDGDPFLRVYVVFLWRKEGNSSGKRGRKKKKKKKKKKSLKQIK
jgi:hypothetical protein